MLSLEPQCPNITPLELYLSTLLCDRNQEQLFLDQHKMNNWRMLISLPSVCQYKLMKCLWFIMEWFYTQKKPPKNKNSPRSASKSNHKMSMSCCVIWWLFHNTPADTVVQTAVYPLSPHPINIMSQLDNVMMIKMTLMQTANGSHYCQLIILNSTADNVWQRVVATYWRVEN